ncbi:PREDICTED: uncharacterized protein LOC109241062 [Nicotiana attenuata]|uniref:uncharacterized protein LOC109241062 n=1 Tax=Nicotiana attenuata TaxID=49451 RepID=UPI0009047B4E|nr:PREDICTED: uncharacterized protein LOC109241062 [Nicotiana attenuata]
MYGKLRGDFDRVSWRKLVYSSVGVPKWNFTVFLAAHRRLLTKDGLRGLGYVEDVTCSLCNSEEETVDHLFFKWKYYKGRSITAELYKLVLAGILYYILQERNGRIFKRVQQPEVTLRRAVTQDVHGRGEINEARNGAKTGAYVQIKLEYSM